NTASPRTVSLPSDVISSAEPSIHCGPIGFDRSDGSRSARRIFLSKLWVPPSKTSLASFMKVTSSRRTAIPPIRNPNSDLSLGLSRADCFNQLDGAFLPITQIIQRRRTIRSGTSGHIREQSSQKALASVGELAVASRRKPAQQ